MEPVESMDLVVTQDALKYAKIIAAKINDIKQRKRAYASIVALDIFSDYLHKQDIEVSITKSLFKVAPLNEEFEISDVYCNGWRIDVRVLNDDTVSIPKLHFEYDIVPDFYVAIKPDKKLKKAKLLGYVDANKIDKSKSNDEYYLISQNSLSDPAGLVKKLKKPNKKAIVDTSHEYFTDSYLAYLDNDIDKSSKQQMLKHLLSCEECRADFVELCDFEVIVANTYIHPDIFEDKTLDVVGALAVDEEKYIGKEQVIDISDDTDKDQRLADVMKSVAAATQIAAEEDISTKVDTSFLDDLVSNNFEDFVDVVGEPEYRNSDNNIIEMEQEIQPKSQAIAVVEPETDNEPVNFDQLDQLTKIEENLIDNVDINPEIDDISLDDLDDLMELDGLEDLGLASETTTPEESFEEDDFQALEDASDINNILNTSSYQDEILEEELKTEEPEYSMQEDNSEADDSTEEEDEELVPFDNLEEVRQNNIQDALASIPAIPSGSDEIPAIVSDIDLNSDDDIDIDLGEDLNFDDEMFKITEELETTSTLIPDDIILSSDDDFQEEYDDSGDFEVIRDKSANYQSQNIQSSETHTYNEHLNNSQVQDIQSIATQFEIGQVEESQPVSMGASEIAGSDSANFEYTQNEIVLTPSVPESNSGVNDIEALYDDSVDAKSYEFSKFAENVNKHSKNQDSKMLILSSVLVSALVIVTILGFLLMSKSNKQKDKDYNNSIVERMDGSSENYDENSMENYDMPVSGTNVTSRTPKDMDKVMTNVFDENPSAITVTKVSWEVSQIIASNAKLAQYLQLAGKNIQTNVKNDLLNSTEFAYNDKMKVAIDIDKNNNIKNVSAVNSSGSEQVDNIVLQSIKETLKYINIPVISADEEKQLKEENKGYKDNTYNFKLVINF